MAELIRPAQSADSLARDIAAAQCRHGSLFVWWLGQSGFVIKAAAGTVVIDPYLSDALTVKYAQTQRPHIRMTAQAIEPAHLHGIDLVLCSHKHTDHMDAATLLPLLETNSRARVIVPAALTTHAKAIGLPPERLIAAADGEQIHAAGWQIDPIAAAHECLDTDPQGRHLYLGYGMSCTGRRLYHSGDGILYPGLIERLSGRVWDVLFLPINGRDPARGVPGNMTATEAVELAGAVKPRFVVPHHYDMFTFNTVPIEHFVAEARRLPDGVEPRIVQCGERWEVDA